jgi:hypothetical protein
MTEGKREEIEVGLGGKNNRNPILRFSGASVSSFVLRFCTVPSASRREIARPLFLLSLLPEAETARAS